MSPRSRSAPWHRDVLVVVLAALVVRLVWNLVVHKPVDYAFADMAGYLERAQTSIDRPDERLPYFTLFPWGTHWVLSLIKRAFGAESGPAIGVVYAMLGAGAAGYGAALAQRYTRNRTLARLVGAILVFYYPWIAFGGYVLSEPPFMLFLGATIYYGLAYADRGRRSDAWLFGGALAIAAIFRPQIVAALPLYGVAWLFMRRTFHRFDAKIILPAIAAPLAFIAVVSAARMHFHTGSYGFVSGNGPLNFAFGRCHATLITSSATDRKGSYAPPSLGALGRYGEEHPDALLKLDPAMGTRLHFDGHMWDAPPLRWMAAECVRKTGLVRQAKYAITHLALLWFYNTAWPDQNHAKYHVHMQVAQALHDVLVLPAAIAAVVLAIVRRHRRAALLALHVAALMAVAAVYFGDTRLRAPYDGVLIVLAASAYTAGIAAIRRRLRRRAPV